MAAQLDESALNVPQWIETCKTAHGPFVFRAVCADIDCALEFGMRGGHVQLQRLLGKAAMLPQPETDELTHPMELLADTIGACSISLPEGFSFPLSPTLPDAYEHVPAVFSFAGTHTDPEHDVSALDANTLCLLVREEWSKRMESQADVGQVLWPAAEIMSRWAAQGKCREWQQAGYRTALELGAGMGLTGLLIAHYMPRVVLTDFNPVVLRNLHYNAVLNTVHSNTSAPTPTTEDTGTARVLPSFFPSEHSVLVRRLDWSLPDSRDPPLTSEAREKLPPLPAATSVVQGSRVQSPAWGVDLHPALDDCPNFDVIIGSDMICCQDDAENVALAVSHWLAPGGTAYFMLPPARVRWGVQFFPPAAEALGLSVTSEVVDASLVEDIVQRPSDASKLRDTSVQGGQSLAALAAEDGQATVATGGGVYETELRVYTVRWSA